MRKWAALRVSSRNLLLLDWLAGQQHLSHRHHTWVHTEANITSILIPLGWFTHTHTHLIKYTYGIYKSYSLYVQNNVAQNIDPYLNDTTVLLMNSDCIDLAGIARQPLSVDRRWVFSRVSREEYEGFTHPSLEWKVEWRLRQASFQVNS